MNKNIERLKSFGQSVWLDSISRKLVVSGGLKDLVNEYGVTGVTSNPTIFEKAISSGREYDESIYRYYKHGHSVEEIFKYVSIEDIQLAADVLRPIYETTSGDDGFVSIEVSPDLAYDTFATVSAAKELFELASRPNVFIKVPATKQGIPAIKELISLGINVNVTLIFSVERYIEVMQAYLDGLEEAHKKGLELSRIHSVASFFVSRVDTKVDRLLEQIAEHDHDVGTIAKSLMGKIAVDNSKIAYQRFIEFFSQESFLQLASKGANVQKPLWASTSTKNPAYSDVLYVQSLIGPNTVNTMPLETIYAFADHGKAERLVDKDVDQSRERIALLATIGIDMHKVTDELEQEGVKAFSDSYHKLLSELQKKVDAFKAPSLSFAWESLYSHTKDVENAVKELESANAVERIWAKDVTLWQAQGVDTNSEISNRLGWLTVAKTTYQQLGELNELVNQISKEEFTHCVLLGMGGSSLAPEVMSKIYGPQNEYPELIVLDSTHPDSILHVENKIDLDKTLFIVSSKSGTTTETISLLRYFLKRIKEQGHSPSNHFVAITDPGTPLEAEAKQNNFRKVFLAPPDIGGRYSALSWYGIAPAAICGVDVASILKSGMAMQDACGIRAIDSNPGSSFAAFLGGLNSKGINKITILSEPGLEAFSSWVDQLFAESTGKLGKGIIPIFGEPVLAPDNYKPDRAFIYLRFDSDLVDSELYKKVNALEKAGFPVYTITLRSKEDIGAEFVRFEFATALAGKLIGVHPFDQPNVQEAKDRTKAILSDNAKKQQVLSQKDALYVGEKKETSLKKALSRLLSKVNDNSYIVIQAYVNQFDKEIADKLQAIRLELLNGLKVATALGFGPRYLHSSGQLHKGGPAIGVFIQITARASDDIVVPNVNYTFEELTLAEAFGDYESLCDKGLPVLKFDTSDLEKGLDQLLSVVSETISAVA